MSCGWRRGLLGGPVPVPARGATPLLPAPPCLAQSSRPRPGRAAPGSTPNRWHPGSLLRRLPEREAGAGGGFGVLEAGRSRGDALTGYPRRQVLLC